MERCVQAKHAESGVRYGYHEDLKHNLIEIYRGRHQDAGNRPYLTNHYGEDPAVQDFDALIKQENRGHAQPVSLVYHFKGADPDVKYPSGQIESFQPVTICPAVPGAGIATPPGPAQRGRGPVPVAQTNLVDPYGVSWTFFINDRGQILRTINHGTSSVRSFNYDNDGRLLAVEQPLGDRLCLQYDSDGNLVRQFSMPVPGAPVLFDHIRQEFTYQKFPNGMFRLQTVADPRNPTRTLVRYGWDQFGNPLTVMDAEGFVTSFTPGRGGVPTQEVRPDVSIVRYDYEQGALSRATVDFAGPAPVVTSLTPDSAGRPRSGVGPFGEVTEWIWQPGLDRLDQLIRRNDGKTETIIHKYDGFGQLQEASNGKRRTVLEYDEQGLLRRVSDFATDGTIPPLDVRDMLDPDPQQPRPDLGPRPAQMTCTRFGPNGRYLETVLPDGSRMRFQYDGEGRVTAVEAGVLASDGSGWDRGCPRFTGPFPAAGVVSSTQYDLNGRPEVIRDGRGQATRITYDGFGNPATVTDAGGTVTRQGFDQMGNVLWSASYPPDRAPVDYRPPAEADAGLLAAVEMQYDAVGRLHIQRRWHFDKDGRRLGGDGRATTTITYDTARRRRLVTDDKAATTIFEFDGAGRPRRTEHPTGGVETIDYSRNGLSVLRTITAPTERGRIAELLRLTSWGAPSRLITNVPLDRRPPESADDVNALLNEVQAGGLRAVLDHAWAYDEHKRLELTRDVGGLVRMFTHDALDREKTSPTEIDAARPPEVVTLAWGRNGLLASRTSAIGTGPAASTLYQHDGLGRLRQIDRPERVTEKRQYEGASPLVSELIDGRGVLVRQRYTPTGLLEVASALNVADQLATIPPGPPVGGPRDPMDGATLFDGCGARRGAACEVRRFFRDALGRTTRATSQLVRSNPGAPNDQPVVVDQVITSMDWDSLGNRTREVNNLVEEGHAISHVHDNLGRPEATTFAGQAFRRQFDAIGRLKALRQGDDARPTVEFDYAGLGAPNKRTLRNGVTTTYTYDVLARLRRLTDASTRPLAAWRWELPADGVPRLAGFTEGTRPEVAAAFEVDRAGRLQREWRGLTGIGLTLSPTAARTAANIQTATAAGLVPSSDVRTYTLDPRHNWTQLDATDNSLDTNPEINQLDAYTSFRGETATYNGDGSLASLGSGETYHYNLFGDAISVTKNGTTRRYLYDAFSRVVRETDDQGSPGSTVVYNWDGHRRAVARRPGSVTQIAVDGDGLDEHLLLVYRGPSDTTFPPGCAGPDCALGGAAPDIVQPPVGGRPATRTSTFFLHQERAGSLYMITDDRGAPVELYDYTAYGETRIRTPEGGGRETSRVANPFGFQGHVFDAQTALVHMRSRLYRPEWGRFVSPDPVGLAGGTNLYAFVASAPLRYVDPFGFRPQEVNVSTRIRNRYMGPTIGADTKPRTGLRGMGTAIDQLYARATYGKRQLDALIPGLILNGLEGFSDAYEDGGVGGVVRTVGRTAVPIDLAESAIRQTVDGVRRGDTRDITEGVLKGAAALLQVRAMTALARTPVADPRTDFVNLLHTRELGLDPARGGAFNPVEAMAGRRLESVVGPLSRDLSGSFDFVNRGGRTFDLVGPVPPEFFDARSFIRSIQNHLLKHGLDTVVVDVTGLSTRQIATVERFVSSLPEASMARILIMHAAED